jgi:streptomycin 6-kinase
VDGVELERVVPGESLVGYDDDVATAELAMAMQSMWRPVPEGCTLPTLAQECLPLFSADLELAPQARQVFKELLASSPDPVVLHGDLHHGNLLRGADGWVAIDPHGVTGDPAYDVGPLLLNPWGSDVAHLTARRLDILTTVLGIDLDRLRAWGFVRAVLSAAWTLEDRELVDERVLGVAASLQTG